MNRFVDSELYPEYEKDEVENFELLNALVELMYRLDEKCREIIDLRFNISAQNRTNDPDAVRKNTPFESVAEQTGLTSANARQRFKRCIKKLRQMVLQNPEFKENYL